jgi:hypothetical protein
MTGKALARRIAESYLTSQQRGEAPAPPQPEGLRGFWLDALLLVGHFAPPSSPDGFRCLLAPAGGGTTLVESLEPVCAPGCPASSRAACFAGGGDPLVVTRLPYLASFPDLRRQRRPPVSGLSSDARDLCAVDRREVWRRVFRALRQES